MCSGLAGVGWIDWRCADETENATGKQRGGPRAAKSSEESQDTAHRDPWLFFFGMSINWPHGTKNLGSVVESCCLRLMPPRTPNRIIPIPVPNPIIR